MIRNPTEGHGGVNIRPAARKSIHDHCGTCPFTYTEAMGRYGCNTHRRLGQRKAGGQEDDQGADVVDNVMRQVVLQNQPSPPPTQHECFPPQSPAANSSSIGPSGTVTNLTKSVTHKICYSKMSPLTATNPLDCIRRRSVDVQNNDQSDDSDDENVLSKSLPATLTLLSYRDEFYSSALQNENNTSRNTLETSGSVLPGRFYPGVNYYDNSNGDVSHEWVTRTHSRKYNCTILLIIFFLSSIAVAIGMRNYYITTSTSTTNNVSNDLNFYNDINSLCAKYKITSDSILRIRTGISTILKNQHTASFIFIYDSNAGNFNPTTFNSFMEELSSKTVKYLRNDGDSAQHVVVDTKNIETDLELMDLQHAVDKTGVMLVPNIHDVPSKLAMAFHFYCDEYNPLVKRSAIFFTLDSATCSIIQSKKLTHEFIEKCLSSKWNNIHEDKIGPLLTRVINILVDATNIG